MNGGLYRGARRLDADLYYFDRGRVYVLFLELESKVTEAVKKHWRLLAFNVSYRLNSSFILNRVKYVGI